MVKTYDSTAGAWTEAATPKVYDSTTGAWIDTVGLVYDSTAGAWVARW